MKHICKKFKIIILSTIILVASVYMLRVTSYADDTGLNQQLAQYYSVLAAQGGNESITKEQAQQLATYYEALVKMQGASQSADTKGANNANDSQTASLQGSSLNVVNVNASEDFYKKECASLYALPEYLKQKLNSNRVIFCLYDRPEYFGMPYNVGGITFGSLWGGNYNFPRKIDVQVNMAEHSAIKLREIAIYHEVGHVINYLVWVKTGQQAVHSSAWDYCVNIDYKKIRKLVGYNHTDNTYEEYFADAIAVFYTNPVELMKQCPQTYNYLLRLDY